MSANSLSRAPIWFLDIAEEGGEREREMRIPNPSGDSAASSCPVLGVTKTVLGRMRSAGKTSLQGVSRPLTSDTSTPLLPLQGSLAPHSSWVAGPASSASNAAAWKEKLLFFLQALAATAVLADSRPPDSCQ